jgi:hypothetical protein
VALLTSESGLLSFENTVLSHGWGFPEKYKPEPLFFKSTLAGG